MSAWQNLHLSIAADRAEEIEARLMAAGALSVSLADAGDSPILEPAPGETPLWPSLTLTALFPAEFDLPPLASALQAAFGLPSRPSIQPVPEQDWTRAWMADFAPMRFGQRVWVCPSWCDPPDPAGVNLMLDPGLAFGSGTHPTTALCLEWLDAQFRPGMTLIDYGCGSGILAIAALKLGAAEVWAVDIDPQAITATRENAARNEIPREGLHVGLPDTLPERADTVVANILSGPLVALADTLCDRLAPAGTLVLSGILEEQADTTAAAYRHRIDWSPALVRDGWVRLTGRRRD